MKKEIDVCIVEHSKVLTDILRNTYEKDDVLVIDRKGFQIVNIQSDEEDFTPVTEIYDFYED